MSLLETNLDFSVMDNLESVTYYQRVTESNFASPGVTCPNALRRELDKEDLASPALLNKIGLVWHLWVNDLSSTVPRVRDVIQDTSNTRWTVISLTFSSLTQRYRLVTIRER